MIPFGEYRPDVSDYNGEHTKNISGVIPRGDGYGPVSQLAPLSSALPGVCRGLFRARKNDGSVLIFAGTSRMLFTMDNTGLSWTPVNVKAAVTIANTTPATFGMVAHGYLANDPIRLTTTGALPGGFSTSTTYYIVGSSISADNFYVSATPGGAAIDASGAGSGTHSATTYYAALSSNAHWRFEQFNNYVFAVQQNVVPQVFDLTSSTAFATLAGSPPQASYISIINRFVVLSGILAPNVYRVHWSGQNATTTWTSGTSQSDFQDLPDGGIVRGVAGGEFGVIFQDQSIRRMTYAPGSPYVFGIDVISKDDGLLAPHSLVRSGDRIFFLSPQGFKMLLPGGYPTPIGKEKIDRTFLSEVDMSNLHMVIGATDPNSTRVYWAYRTTSYASGLTNKVLVYDWALERWSTFPQVGEYLATLARPGITLENVDTAFGSNLDTLSLGSLDDISLASNPVLAGVDSAHKVGLFSGTSMEATMETPEQGGDRRMFVRGFRPVTDATSVYGSVSMRETQQALPSYSGESAVNSLGRCDQRLTTRYARAKVRIPAGASWSFAAGIEPDVTPEGQK